jgi:predicted peptidase
MHLRHVALLLLLLLLRASTITAQQQEKRMVSYTNYLLYVPKALPTNGLYPLMLFLHENDERGNDLSILKRKGPPSFLDDKNDFPFVVVSPQCPVKMIFLLSLFHHSVL